MIDQKTSNLQLPLPHPGNELQDDILRLRDAFTAIDSKIAAIDLLLTSDDISLDTVQELVTAIKLARTDIGLVNALIDDRIAATNQVVATKLDAPAVNAVVNEQVASQLAPYVALIYAGL